jgi:hypothetical protein
MAGAPPTAQKFTVTTQATAASVLGTAYFPPGRAYCQVYCLNGSSTKIDFQIQGSVSNSSAWFNLTAAPTSATTGASWTCSTYTNRIFDRVRIYTTDAWSATTIAGGVSYPFWIDARGA